MARIVFKLSSSLTLALALALFSLHAVTATSVPPQMRDVTQLSRRAARGSLDVNILTMDPSLPFP